MTIEERAKNIIQDIEMEQGKNPVKISGWRMFACSI